nr:hypothetical protein [uncultured Sphingomonas sp.]
MAVDGVVRPSGVAIADSTPIKATVLDHHSRYKLAMLTGANDRSSMSTAIMEAAPERNG